MARLRSSSTFRSVILRSMHLAATRNRPQVPFIRFLSDGCLKNFSPADLCFGNWCRPVCDCRIAHRKGGQSRGNQGEHLSTRSSSRHQDRHCGNIVCGESRCVGRAGFSPGAISELSVWRTRSLRGSVKGVLFFVAPVRCSDKSDSPRFRMPPQNFLAHSPLVFDRGVVNVAGEADATALAKLYSKFERAGAGAFCTRAGRTPTRTRGARARGQDREQEARRQATHAVARRRAANGPDQSHR